MREVISYDKDFITGKVIEKKKHKPNMPMRNSALIELFDAKTGEKQREIYSENIIENDLLYRAMFRHFVIHQGLAGTDRSVSGYIFERILLLRDIGDGSEKLEDLMFRGHSTGSSDVVGWVDVKDTAFPGTNSKRGRYDASDANSRIVTDFANGKVTQSIVYEFTIYAANSAPIKAIKWQGGTTPFSVNSRVPSGSSNSFSFSFRDDDGMMVEAYPFFSTADFSEYEPHDRNCLYNGSKYAMIGYSFRENRTVHIVDLEDTGESALKFDSYIDEGIQSYDSSADYNIQIAKGPKHYAVWNSTKLAMFNTDTGALTVYENMNTKSYSVDGDTYSWSNLTGSGNEYPLSRGYIDEDGKLYGWYRYGSTHEIRMVTLDPATDTLTVDDEFLSALAPRRTSTLEGGYLHFVKSGAEDRKVVLFGRSPDLFFKEDTGDYGHRGSVNANWAKNRQINTDDTLDSVRGMVLLSSGVHVLKSYYPRFSAANRLPSAINKSELQTMRLTYTFEYDASQMI